LAEPSKRQPESLASTVEDVSQRVTLLVREEIELAKAEVTAKVTTLARGAAVAAAAGVFILLAVMFALHGVAWLLFYTLPVGNSLTFFWGFFALAVILLLVGALAGFAAYRALRTAKPPTPQMAIDEARKIRATVTSSTSSSGEH